MRGPRDSAQCHSPRMPPRYAQATAVPASSGQVTCVETDIEQTGAEATLSRTPSFALPNCSGGSALSPLATVLRWRPPAAAPEEVSIASHCAARRSLPEGVLLEYLTHPNVLLEYLTHPKGYCLST